jgi:glycosyltransferase involved in cell wall biosynthesis
VRLGVYSDYSYRVVDGAVSAERPFSLFVDGLSAHCERLVVFGRLDPNPEPFPFRVQSARLVELPYYPSGADLGSVLRSLPAAMKRFWREMRTLDVVWVLGPNPPHALLFGILGLIRGRKVVLGVRQNLPELIRHRRSERRAVVAAAYVLEWAFRTLARITPVIVVGPDIARRYRGSRSLLEIYVSLLRDVDLESGDRTERDYDADELVMLSVGRLDPEKNPVLMADVLTLAVAADPRWRLEVCGDGVLRDELVRRASDLGVADRIRLHGYVPIDDGLWDQYRSAHALLHVSMTEGVPQVIMEAFAAQLPVVATAVGGVPALVEGCGLLCPPGDAAAAAAALQRMITEPDLRRQLVAEARAKVEGETLEATCARVAAFLSAGTKSP